MSHANGVADGHLEDAQVEKPRRDTRPPATGDGAFVRAAEARRQVAADLEAGAQASRTDLGIDGQGPSIDWLMLR